MTVRGIVLRKAMECFVVMDYKIGGQWKPKFISDEDSRWHTSSKNIKSGDRAMNNGGHWIHRNQGTKPVKN